MKTITAVVFGAGVLFASSVFADAAHHPGNPSANARMPGADMMAAHMEMMRSQLDRISSATSDAEREAAMTEHMQAMQQGMGMAGGQAMPMGMSGCPMMQGGMMGGHAMGDMGQRMHQLEQRMDMMQMMMKNMMGARGPMAEPVK